MWHILCLVVRQPFWDFYGTDPSAHPIIGFGSGIGYIHAVDDKLVVMKSHCFGLRRHVGPIAVRLSGHGTSKAYLHLFCIGSIYPEVGIPMGIYAGPLHPIKIVLVGKGAFRKRLS